MKKQWADADDAPWKLAERPFSLVREHLSAYRFAEKPELIAAFGGALVSITVGRLGACSLT